MIVITVARRPLSATNVASNVLTHGTGALNIDACRIETADNLNGGAYSAGASARHDGAENWRYKRGNEGGLAEKDFTQPTGRWPANLVLEHLPGCRSTGTRKLRGSRPAAGGMDRLNAANAAQGYRPGTYQKNKAVFAPNRVDEDGMEMVATWQCVEGCPIADLNESSGESKSSGFGGRVVVKRRTGVEREGNTTPRFGAESRPDGAVMSSYDDAGGASRFFKQIGGQTE